MVLTNEASNDDDYGIENEELKMIMRMRTIMRMIMRMIMRTKMKMKVEVTIIVLWLMNEW